LKNPVIAKLKGRPLVLFPDGWSEGWMHPEFEDGNFPLYLAECYLIKASQAGESRKFQFGRLPATVKEWAEYRESYYLGLCTSPFGYESPGKSFAPHGMSVHGVPKLHPGDE
jgi:hypothetical protein